MADQPVVAGDTAQGWRFRTIAIPGAWGLVLGISIFTILGGPREVLETFTSYNWPQVMGRIEASEVTRSSRAPWTGAGVSRSGRAMYYTHVRYAYQVGEQIFSGDRIYAMEAGHSFARAHELHRQFAEGRTVPVYYNPDDPARAVLLPGLNLTTGGILALMVAVVVGLATKGFGGRLRVSSSSDPG